MGKVSVAHARRKKNAARSSSSVSQRWVFVIITLAIAHRFAESALRVSPSTEVPCVPATSAPTVTPTTTAPSPPSPSPRLPLRPPSSCPTNKGQQRLRR